MFLLLAALGSSLPLTARAQEASIFVTATVQARPLTLVDAALTAVPGELRVRFDGCGSGALTMDVRTTEGTQRRSRAVIEPSTTCTARSVVLRLPANLTGAGAVVVTLEQSQAMISPAFAQFVVPASALVRRAGVAY